MKLLTTLLLLSTILFAYQKGSTLTQSTLTQLSMTQEKIYVIAFFASWCPSCKDELPYISKVNKTVDKKLVEIVGVCVDESIKDGQKFQKELTDAGSLNFRVINDPEGKIIEKFNPAGIPALYFIKNGKVEHYIIGSRSNIDKRVKQILKELK